MTYRIYVKIILFENYFKKIYLKNILIFMKIYVQNIEQNGLYIINYTK